MDFLPVEHTTAAGVTRDSLMTGLNEKPAPFVFLPLYQGYRASMIINAKVSGDPLAFGKTVERTIHELNGDLVVFEVTSLELREQFASFGQRIAGTFAGEVGCWSCERRSRRGMAAGKSPGTQDSMAPNPERIMQRGVEARACVCYST
ncbi:MAG: hypothetical protein WA755_00380 [Candidatus Acidiferrales bacterium]